MDKSYFTLLIQKILIKEFPNSIKRQKINEFSDRANFCCVYCGDGKNENKKRANIYWNRAQFICFNCGKQTSLDRLCKDFNEQLDPSKKLELINHLDSVISYKDTESDFVDAEFSKLIDISEIDRIFNSGENAITDFKSVQKNSEIFKYLINRGISQKLQHNIYEAKYWFNEEKYQPIIVILNRKGNKILGIQIRNLKEGKRRFFKIYNFETLYKWVTNQEDISDIDINQLVIYNKLSYYFNILNVDFSGLITIFEGYLDSLFFPNSIGIVGTNTDLKFIENNDLNLQYMFDNDKAGFKKSEEKLKNEYPVFLWKKLFENIVNQKTSEDPFKLMDRISKIKDLNTLSEIIKDPYDKLNLQKYFSSDIYDIKYLPKQIEKKKYIKYTRST